MAEKRGTNTWTWILVGLLVALIVGFGLFVGIGMVAVTRNMQVTQTDEPAADRAFESARARFAGQVPLVTLDGEALASRAELDRRLATHAGPAPGQMWVMAYESKERKLVRLSIPFWLIRMSPSSDVTFDVPGLGKRRAHITTEEIQQAGPGLLLDQTVEGVKLLIWTE